MWGAARRSSPLHRALTSRLKNLFVFSRGKTVSSGLATVCSAVCGASTLLSEALPYGSSAASAVAAAPRPVSLLASKKEVRFLSEDTGGREKSWVGAPSKRSCRLREGAAAAPGDGLCAGERCNRAGVEGGAGCEVAGGADENLRWASRRLKLRSPRRA